MDLNVLPEFASNNLASRGILEYHTLPIRKKIGDFVIRCLDLLPGEIFPFDYHTSGQRSSGDEKIKSKSDHSKWDENLLWNFSESFWIYQRSIQFAE